MSPSKLTFLFRALSLLMGGMHTWAAMASHSMNADGISYLDIGDAYMQGNWDLAINSVWSPLYSWILGPVMAVFNPSMQWEFPLVHLINFVIFLSALLSFEFFWRQAWDGLVERLKPDRITWPEWAWWTIGYLLFIWTSLTLIEIWAVTPDMLMSALVYLAAGLLIRIRRGDARRKTFLGLGAFLGLSYLAKAIMFPVSLVCLSVALVSTGNLRLRFFQVVGTILAFIVITLPFILLISNKAGKLTFGEAGEITYVRYVNGVTYPHWQGEPPGNGVPIHPSQQIFEYPPIYEFGAPIQSTYPISLNPVYWYEGVEAHLDFSQQTRLVLASILFYADLFAGQLGGIIAGIFVLYLLTEWKKKPLLEWVCEWSVAIPALAGLALYAMVLVEGRYIGVFIVLLMAELFGNISLQDTKGSRRLIAGIAGFMAFVLLVNLAAFNLRGLTDFNQNRTIGQSTESHPPRWPGEVAEELHSLGVQPGDPVAVIGYAFDSFWARLARVRIVAEMLSTDADLFWVGDESLQSDVIQAFANTGAKAIIAENVPSYTSLSGWKQVHDSNYYIYLTQ